MKLFIAAFLFALATILIGLQAFNIVTPTEYDLVELGLTALAGGLFVAFIPVNE